MAKRIIYGLIVTFVFIFGIVLGSINLTASKDIYEGVNLPSYYHCSGLNLYDTAICLRKLTEQNLDVNKNCEDYANEYEIMAQDLGYASKKVMIGTDINETNNYFSHSFTLIFDDGGYCILDKNNLPKCNRIKNG